jgi:hypothetical protein
VDRDGDTTIIRVADGGGRLDIKDNHNADSEGVGVEILKEEV